MIKTRPLREFLDEYHKHRTARINECRNLANKFMIEQPIRLRYFGSAGEELATFLFLIGHKFRNRLPEPVHVLIEALDALPLDHDEAMIRELQAKIPNRQAISREIQEFWGTFSRHFDLTYSSGIDVVADLETLVREALNMQFTVELNHDTIVSPQFTGERHGLVGLRSDGRRHAEEHRGRAEVSAFGDDRECSRTGVYAAGPGGPRFSAEELDRSKLSGEE